MIDITMLIILLVLTEIGALLKSIAHKKVTGKRNTLRGILNNIGISYMFVFLINLLINSEIMRPIAFITITIASLLIAVITTTNKGFRVISNGVVFTDRDIVRSYMTHVPIIHITLSSIYLVSTLQII